MRIGILVCGRPPDEVVKTTGHFDQMFRDLLADRDLSFAVYDVENLDFPSDMHAQEGWLITGSKHGAYEDHEFIPRLEQFIRDCSDARVPMVGICFGHQIMAQALGGRVEKFSGGWNVGRKAYDFENMGKVHLTAWHQDQVVALPPGAQVIGSSAACAAAGLAYGDWGLSFQPHPEILGNTVKSYVTAQAGKVPQPLLDRALAEADKPTDHDAFADRIAAFFHQQR